MSKDRKDKKDKIIYFRTTEDLRKKMDKLIEEYNETYPQNIKLKMSSLVDIILRGTLRDIEKPEEIRELLKKSI